VVFVRSSSGTDPVGDLWVLDVDTAASTAVERRVVDARTLLAGESHEDLPDAERARRERLREVGEGIAAFATDMAVLRATFALAGRVFVVDLTDAAAAPQHVHVPGIDAGAVDPRLSPDGTRLGFVVGCALVIVNLDSRGGVSPDSRVLTIGEPADDRSPEDFDTGDSSTITWGLADFIAAEEFSRVRGWWWQADSTGVIVERVDNAPVSTWWIADPANPASPPREQRYPAAGTENAALSLWLVDVTGDQFGRRREIGWDHDQFPYLTSVHVGRDAGSDPIIAVLSRDQRHQQVIRIHPDSGDAHMIGEHHDDAWIDVIPGAPRLDPRGRLIDVGRDAQTDTDRLFIDGDPVSPIGFQVRSVGDLATDGLIVDGSSDPIEEIPVLVDDAGWHPLIESGIAAARRAGNLVVLSTATPATSTQPPGTSTMIGALSVNAAAGATPAITPIARLHSFCETPIATPQVHLSRSGPDALPTAVLWPTGHVRGSRKLPVLLAPYGGPHARRVVDSRLAFATDQWWADQGFCVVIADGRGTPGRGPAWERAVLDDLATGVLHDQIAALDAVLAAHPDDTDAHRVGIHGWSFGGYLAALAVLRRPDRIHAAVAGAPVTEWRLYDTAYTERYLGDPAINTAAYDGCSLLTDAAALTRPLLLVHGLADDNVVVAHTLQLSSALLAAGRSHSVLPLSGVTHMTPQEVIAENLLLAQRDFLLSHLSR
jgi:dipeptidyl-peptidase-4